MLPEVSLFGVTISTYYSMMGAGFLAMVFLMLRRRARFGLRAPGAVAFAVLVMLTGLVGCKLLYIAENYPAPVTLGGFSFFGAVFLVPPLMALSGLLFRLRPGRSLDACAPCVTAMVGVIRVGCFLNGCCGGRLFSIAGHTLRWPTQMAESVGDLVILFWLLTCEEKGREGLYPRFLLAYGALRFVIEFFRDTPKDWLGLSHGQWFSIGAVMVGALWLYLTAFAAGRRNA